MQSSSTKHGLPAGNPLASLLVVIAGVVAIATAIVLGFFAFVVLSAVVLVAATLIGVRSWWHGGKNVTRRPYAKAGKSASNHVIEGEYRVVDADRDKP